MPIILLIRHGENDFVKTGRMAGRTPGVHLNERGKQQAQELAEALAKAPIKAIYSSPMERAIETAEPLAAKLGQEIIIRPSLIEANIGDWTGLEIKVTRKLPEWKIVQNAPSRFRFPGGESFVEIQTRLVSDIELIAHEHKDDQMVACFLHADPIKLIVAYYMGMPLDHFQRLGCDTASAAVLMLGGSGAGLLKLNQRPPFNFPVPDGKKHKSKKG
jgi:probable phosphoglycerate mutase